MDFETLKQKDNEYIVNTYKRNDILITSGKNSKCKDINSKEYIDFTSGVGVNSLGFCNSNWSKAVSDQVNKLNHTSNLFYTEPQIQLAEKLCKLTDMKKAFFTNSGAEANETMIKAARKYGMDKLGKDRYEIITLESSFHGRTFGALAATAQPIFQKPFGKSLDGFAYAEPDNLESLKRVVSDKTCAVMMELIQGESGVNDLDIDYVQGVEKFCKENDLLLLIDEVQTGVGRTGSFLVCEQYGIKPNIVSLAKGLGGGLPIGATLFDEKTENVLIYGNHGTTFGGNPITCAGALAVLDCMNDSLFDDVKNKGEYLKNKISALPHVKSISGMGMMIGVELDGIAASEVIKNAMDIGLMLLSAKDKVRLLPPLNITYSDIDDGLAILEKTLLAF